MAETNINLYLNSLEETSSPSNPSDKNKQNANNPKKSGEGKNNDKNTTAIVALQVLKNGVSGASQRAGEMFGSNQLQRKINDYGTIFAYSASIIANPLIGLTSLAINSTFNVIDYGLQKRNEERSLSVLKARAGVTLNRSR